MKRFIRISLTVVVIGIFSVSVSGCFGNFFGNKSEKIDMKKSLDAEGINEITIDGELVEIHIHTHNQNKIKAEVTGSVSKNLVADFQADTSGESATIKFSQDQKFPISYDSSELIPELNVYIPDKTYEALTLKTSFGDIMSEKELLAKRINVSADEGDVVLNGYHGELIKGTINFGNITLQQLDASVNLKSDEGNVNISPTAELKGQNQINAKFGDVKIKLPREPEGLSLDLKTNFGEIHSDFSVVKSENGDENVLKGTIGKPKANSPTLSIITDSGDVSLVQ
ncbi:DUF4097 family beta strand repeat-containing protein [Pseudogracilibacillus sp. SO30301A]|uniref:DUF4097 family beta strand repeat-containing protein n=1 Tax=Pseudogracilibacillus sp. SO30301A TaxID=3098291 RepID=UPI00300DD268